jgi:hypothetical protein
LQRVLAVGLILTGIAVVVFGGYYLYNRNSSTNAASEEANLNDAPIQQAPIDTAASKIDSTVLVKPAGTYRYILEVTDNKKRALKRYSQLKSMAIDVKMESQDSTNFKLYFIIPSTAADTIRIKDSLNNYYGRRIAVEQ